MFIFLISTLGVNVGDNLPLLFALDCSGARLVSKLLGLVCLLFGDRRTRGGAPDGHQHVGVRRLGLHVRPFPLCCASEVERRARFPYSMQILFVEHGK